MLGDKVPGIIDRTTARSYLTIPTGFQPELLVTLLKPFRDELRLIDERGDIEIGPIPAGVPVDLISNLDLRPDRMGLLDRVKHDAKLAKLLVKADARPALDARGRRRRARRGRRSPTWSSRCSSSASARTSWSIAATISAPTSSPRSPASSDAQKRDLIEFLKTL